VRREDAKRFLEEVRGNDPEVAAKHRVETNRQVNTTSLEIGGFVLVELRSSRRSVSRRRSSRVGR